ncbi:MAG: beta-ketoacyl synthase chain length factor [Bacteroidetes bacterium]|nr:beta-ketoacyl synthase chain length factor [Bacteroidota bacterium]
MFYIHDTICISPQTSYTDIDLGKINGPVENKLLAKEPSYEGIPLGILRRMGRAVRMGVGAALQITKQNLDGIIIGTGNGGMEDCIKFLNQIIEYEEGMLTPTNFVQSTTNAIAGQIGLMTKNKGYNCTHVHRGLAFENAIIDADMLLTENSSAKYLLGAVDEISAYNYNIDLLDGWFKKEKLTNENLYDLNSAGSIAGEGAAMFLASKEKIGASAEIKAIHILHSDNEQMIASELKKFISKYTSEEKLNLVLSGENGDNRLQKYYSTCETQLPEKLAIARFKHLFGEHASASALAVWLSCQIIIKQSVPKHLLKFPANNAGINEILIYNNHKGIQHSFILISRVDG